MDSKHADWEIVLRFYCCIHWVESYLVKLTGHKSDNHPERRQRVRSDSSLGRIAPAYCRLQDMAWDVRYNPTYQARPADIESARKTNASVEALIIPLLFKTSRR